MKQQKKMFHKKQVQQNNHGDEIEQMWILHHRLRGLVTTTLFCIPSFLCLRRARNINILINLKRIDYPDSLVMVLTYRITAYFTLSSCFSCHCSGESCSSLQPQAHQSTQLLTLCFLMFVW